MKGDRQDRNHEYPYIMIERHHNVNGKRTIQQKFGYPIICTFFIDQGDPKAQRDEYH